jgi:peroxiredoxin
VGIVKKLFVLLLCFYGSHTAAQSLLDFSLPNLQAQGNLNLEDYRGKVLLVSFFEPDCSWCFRQMKAFNRLVETCDHVQPIAVGVNGNNQQLRKELRRAKVQFPGLKANRQLIEAVGDVPATPWTLVADQQGNLVATMTCPQILNH